MPATPETSRDILNRLGRGQSIASICQAQHWTREVFDRWWKAETARRNPTTAASLSTAVQAPVTIQRDQWGIPHISAQNESDVWFGFGYAMAQDRLFQLDYLRRKGQGRLAEILGAEALPLDTAARTVGLNRIAAAELNRIPATTRAVLDAFSAGVNTWMQSCGANVPIEFDLLDYRPEPWSAVDSLAIEVEFRWYLTGRFPVIVMPEFAKRILGEGPRYQEYLLGEADAESIVPPEAYQHLRRQTASEVWDRLSSLPKELVGQATGDPEGTGSNNWVIAGKHCRGGAGMVASDPHIALEAVSCWYEAHLTCDQFNVAGMAYAGMPAIMFGRNEHLAWGITNNICSLRDLYQERTDPNDPGCFDFNGTWERAKQLTETITVRNSDPVNLTVQFSRNGPVVNEILPLSYEQTGPVTLKWLGAYEGGWLTSLLAMDRSRTVSEFREALRPWHVPTFNLVIADREGTIAVQCAGRIPLRNTAERGYRAGWNPEHQWVGLLPFEALPNCINPERGWLATANNRLAGDDYPYPLFGTWISGYRAERIRHMIETQIALRQTDPKNQGFELAQHRDIQQDSISLRAVHCVPHLVTALSAIPHPRLQEALKLLRDWDGRIEPNLAAPTIFNVFFTNWSRAVADVYFEGEVAELLARQAEGVASRLLASDPCEWFPAGQRELRLQQVFLKTLAELTERFGDQMSDWTWDRLHVMPLKHVLSSRGDLGQLLDHGYSPVKGDMITVCNTGSGPDWTANTGAGYRLVADLAENGLWAVDASSQSGNPGSPHYSDQFTDWNQGNYHYIPLNPNDVVASQVLNLQPEQAKPQ